MDPIHAAVFLDLATRRRGGPLADPLEAPEWRPYLGLARGLARLMRRLARP